MSNYLLVCSGGGHLKQLFTLASRFGIAPEEQHWVTFDNGLSRSLLADRRVTYSAFAGPRDAVPIARNAMLAHSILRRGDYDAVLSTGSSPAVSFMPEAAMRGIPCHYIESAARADGPSITGKIVSRIRGVATYTQYPAWETESWKYRGSIFDAYASSVDLDRANTPIRKAVVSVGTQDGYPFRRLFEHLVPLLDGVETMWQSGTTDVSDLGIDGRHSVMHHELSHAVAEADVVIAHAGTGAAITAIEEGKIPILVPRLAKHGEHIDDHQIQIARELSRRGLAISVSAEELTHEVLAEAASRSAVLAPNVPAFPLDTISSRARSGSRRKPSAPPQAA